MIYTKQYGLGDDWWHILYNMVLVMIGDLCHHMVQVIISELQYIIQYGLGDDWWSMLQNGLGDYWWSMLPYGLGDDDLYYHMV